MFGKRPRIDINREASARLQVAFRDLIQTGRIHKVSMDKDHHSILTWYCVQGKTQVEIADMMNVSQIAVSRKLRSAYKKVLMEYPNKGVRDMLVEVMRGTRAPMITEDDFRKAEAIENRDNIR